MTIRLRLSLKAPNEGQDTFFLWSMVILPIVAECSYILDAYYYLTHGSTIHRYQGLVSTIVVVFTYLRYCAPIESRKVLAAFYIFLCTLNEVGTIGYLTVYLRDKDDFHVAVYIGWGLLELVTTSLLIFYRVHRGCQPNFHVESKHLFQFISRLEVILAIFIPFFIHNMSVTLTKHSIAFFLLFEFFSDSYSRFQGFWIKATLYVFVGTVTVCVASEWIYSNQHEHSIELLSTSFELLSGVLCNTLIILQFSPYHFKPSMISKIAREGLVFHQLNESNPHLEMMSVMAVQDDKSQETIIDLIE